MPLIVELGVGALIALTTWFGALVFGRWWQPSRRRRTIWRMDIGRESQPTLIIDNVQGAQTVDYTRPSTGLGAAVSASLVVNSLNAAQAALFRHYSLRREEPIEVLLAVDEAAVDACSQRDTVIIGGPKNNRFAREFLDSVGCQAEIDPETATSVCVNNPSRVGIATVENEIWWYGRRYKGSVFSDEPTPTRLSQFNGTDYGVIIRSFGHVSGGGRPTRTVLLFGSQTFGVIGATRYLVSAMDLKKSRLPKERELRRALARSQNIAILVLAEVRDGKVRPGQLIDFYRLSDSIGLGGPRC